MTTMLDTARALINAAPKCAECGCAATRSVIAARVPERLLCSRWQCFDLWEQQLPLRTQLDEDWTIRENAEWKHAAEVARAYGLEE